jgi:hypothetical protein
MKAVLIFSIALLPFDSFMNFSFLHSSGLLRNLPAILGQSPPSRQVFSRPQILPSLRAEFLLNNGS